MSSGSLFVETIRKLGYEKAAKLNGEDFDWLFETVDKSFLEWFCGNINKQHVLPEEKLIAFNSLKESGKSILDEKALDEVLKTCKLSESKNSCTDEVAFVKLEDELQELQKVKSQKIQQRNKLQMMAASASHMSLVLKDQEEEVTKVLKDPHRALNAVNIKINSELQSLFESVKMLISFFTLSEGQDRGPRATFLSQLVLETYLSQEEQSTSALTLYTKKQFFEGITELVESSNEENFQLVDINRPSIYDESTDVREERRHEMARLQLAYICAKHQFIQLKSKTESIKIGLQWAGHNLHSIQSKQAVGKEQQLETRISSLKNELLLLKSQVDQINKETLPCSVKDNAQLLNMPIVKGDFDLQIARQDYYTSRQDMVCGQLIKQKSSFELLQLAYEIELRKHREIHRQLENLIQELKHSSKELEKRFDSLLDPLIQYPKQRNTIDSNDTSTHRLYQLIDGENKKQQLFTTYNGLEQVAQKLMQDIISLQDQLAISDKEQSLSLSKLDADLESLYDSLYCGVQDPLLSAQEITEHIQQLEAQLNKLNQLVLGIVTDTKAKRKILETDKLHQMEKQLYVYFFKDDDGLKDIIEKLESEANLF
ncbi:HAUS augmin-like complex subunit 3 isoform X2 [Microcaecilia unicolor]|nr:HAUS augmin-like complex subunit 3 isoform X2 [Microcaecilia unicolor]XP_030048440.1 HAUS augmin-like complex subunit 3 isoform X2 [Microcaecilia unicolor]XP_030048442.1 HAUS augmin-like complex subunit 3 isoform X2 [Microcaecilia unicolor]XP_030048443.1 HAUS augmin-like complex subunit 3 isoform X2 [Microcaecilia unicolor]